MPILYISTRADITAPIAVIPGAARGRTAGPRARRERSPRGGRPRRRRRRRRSSGRRRAASTRRGPRGRPSGSRAGRGRSPCRAARRSRRRSASRRVIAGASVSPAILPSNHARIASIVSCTSRGPPAGAVASRWSRSSSRIPKTMVARSPPARIVTIRTRRSSRGKASARRSRSAIESLTGSTPDSAPRGAVLGRSHAASSGAIRDGSSVAGLFTRGETGYASMAPAGYGPRMARSSSGRGRLARDPALLVLRPEDHGHPVVERGHDLVGRRGDDRVGGMRRAVGVVPDVVEAGEREGARVPEAEVVRRLPAAAVPPPLVEPARRHQAAVVLEQPAEHRPLGEGLGPGVDRPAGLFGSLAQCGTSPHCIGTISRCSRCTTTGMLWDGATLNRERQPSVGWYTRNRLPRSSVQMSEYRPHMVRFLSRGDESRLRNGPPPPSTGAVDSVFTATGERAPYRPGRPGGDDRSR